MAGETSEVSSFGSLNVGASSLKDITSSPSVVSLIPLQNSISSPSVSSTNNKVNFFLHVKLSDSNNNPISGAIVTLHSQTQQGVTNSDGIAFFRYIEAGSHTVDIAYNNETVKQLLTIGGDPLHTYELAVTLNVENPFLNRIVLIVIGALIFITLVLGGGVFLERKRKKI